jgi:predicted nuclease of predicted toxin-antitoxin system
VILWVDAQIAPSVAHWLTQRFEIDAVAVRDVGLLTAKDREIFDAAREAGAVVMTKDSDFVDLLTRLGAPPQLIWITCGNTSNQYLIRILESSMPTAMRMLNEGEPLIEISDIWSDPS